MSRGGGPQLPRRSASGAFSEYQSVERDGNRPRHGKRGSSVVSALTVSLPQTYQRCSPHFTYNHQLAPRRVLTKPSEGVENQGLDNASSDLIVSVGDVFVSTSGARYMVRDLLGQGTFGQVFRCVEAEGGAQVAVKVIKNQPAYYHQARVEVGVLQYLNTRADPADKHHIVRMKDFFLFRNHLCLAFELLNLNLYELIRHNKFRGLSLPLVRVFTTQILDALVVLRDSRIVHCDLKPENVLLKTVETGEVKVIDFGSACFENRTVYSYIQSRFYRSPEVVVGYPYTMAIDMWSLGCMAAELYLGLPLFPGACEHDLLSRMVSMLGPLPDYLLAHGKNTHKLFKLAQEEVVTDAATGEAVVRRRYAVRSREEYEAATGQPAPVGKNYFQHTSLADIIGAYPMRGSMSDECLAREKALREAFVDFLLGVLDLDPSSRWTPRQAQQHPFITGERFTGPFQPPADPSSTPNATRRWGAVSPSPTPVGTPMSIPATRNARASQSAAAAAGGLGAATPTWLPGMAGASGSAAAALMATSPQVHAQAHAAAMAAVQAQMSLRQQQAAVAQQQQQHVAAALGGTSAAGGVTNGFYPLPAAPLPADYSAAHSLQAIIPTLAAAVAASYGAASLGGTPMAHSLTTPLLTPPSRSFGPHLRYGEYALDGSGGLASSLHTPNRSGGVAFSPMQLGSFTPSSVTTYQAALAAAHAALLQPQQQQAGLSQSARMAHAAASVAAAGRAPGPGSCSLTGAQHSPYQLAGARGAWGSQVAAHPAQQSAWGGRHGLGAGVGAGLAAALPPYLPHAEPSAAAGLLAAGAGAGAGGVGVGMAAGEASRAGSRWVSMEGSLEGTPPRLGGEGLAAAAAADESGPNPADWDPLWSDDLLEEDSQAGGGAGGGGGRGPDASQKGSPAAAALRSAQQQQQQQQQQPRPERVAAAGLTTNAPPLYGGDWFREQAQQRQQAEQQEEGSAPSDAELPGSYCLPLPTTLLAGLRGTPQPQECGAAAAAATAAATVQPDLPLPSSALLQGSQGRLGERQQQQQQQAGRPGEGRGAGEQSHLAALLLAAAQQSQQQEQQQQQRQRRPWEQPGGTEPAAHQSAHQAGAAVTSSSFEFHRSGLRQQQQQQLPLPSRMGPEAAGGGGGGALQLGTHQPTGLLAPYQQQQQQSQAGVGYGAPPFGLPTSWQGPAVSVNPALDSPAVALQHALSAQLSTRLTNDLALSGLARDGLTGSDAEAAVAVVAAAAASYQAAQQQQQQSWAYAADEQQQHLAARQNQPMQRMQGFDIHK